MTEEQHLLSGAPAGRAGATLTQPSLAVARVSPQRHLLYVFRSMRPRQWTKNLIVYMAMLFSINLDWKIHDPSS